MIVDVARVVCCKMVGTIATNLALSMSVECTI